jgi:hypothetical protein
MNIECYIEPLTLHLQMRLSSLDCKYIADPMILLGGNAEVSVRILYNPSVSISLIYVKTGTLR